ncbi:NAC domain-containing protein 96 [Manihot esculenta]|uniref:NAC domain-containing protein 96 n=1 Tax=Manihot esculenta TaxID=3983 RepID=UPI000B5D532C|nr:NAC domain-containing protein 96 [Manihot esculenta]
MTGFCNLLILALINMVSAVCNNSLDVRITEEEEVEEVTEDNQVGSEVWNFKLDELKLACGYRFSPHDSELIVHYLLRKILGQQLPVNIIPEIDLYQYDADQLPISEFKHGKPGEAYFFTRVERRYSRGSSWKRTTKTGFWKATGSDVQVEYKNKVIGLKKTMVFYWGKAPVGEKSPWIMHEYRVHPNFFSQDDEYDRFKSMLESYVVCRIRSKGEDSDSESKSFRRKAGKKNRKFK